MIQNPAARRIGMVFIGAIGLSLATQIAPKAFTAQMVALIAIVAGLALFTARRPIHRGLYVDLED